MKKYIAILVMLLSCGVTIAAQVSEDVILHVRGVRPLTPIQTETGDEILVFSEEPIQVTVVATLPEQEGEVVAKAASNTVTDEVTIKVNTRARGNEKTVGRVRRIQNETVRYNTLEHSNRGTVRVAEVSGSLAELAPGMYQFEAAKGRVISSTVFVTVARGSETPEIERLYLRHKAENLRVSADFQFDLYLELMRRLVDLEPENAMLYDELGDVSLNNAPLETTRAFYSKAESMMRSQLQEQEARVPKAIAQLVKRKLSKYESFDAVFGDLQRRRDTEDIVVLNIASRERFAIVDRASRSVLRMY